MARNAFGIAPHTGYHIAIHPGYRYNHSMKISVTGNNPTGLLLGGLLSLSGHDVSFTPPEVNPGSRSDLRIILPDRWLTVKNLVYAANNSADIFLLCPGKETDYKKISRWYHDRKNSKKESTCILIAGNREMLPGDEAAPWAATFFLPLWEAVMLQEDQVELYSPRSLFIIEKNKSLVKLVSPLKKFRIKSRFVECINPYYDTTLLYRCLDLPVALCNTTINHFLSYPGGRKICQQVLLEGFKVYEKLERPLTGLPMQDPGRLLLRIQKKAGSFNAHRYLPERRINPVLQSLLLNEKSCVPVNTHLIKMAAAAGTTVFWNEKLASLLSQVRRTGFFKDPAALLKAVE